MSALTERMGPRTSWPERCQVEGCDRLAVAIWHGYEVCAEHEGRDDAPPAQAAHRGEHEA